MDEKKPPSPKVSTPLEPDCPLPDRPDDIITLGHGSGGQLTNQLLEQGIFSLLENDYLKSRHDGALIRLPGAVAFTTDSFVVNPIFFPGGNIGDLAVNGTVNDIAMCGAIPRYLSLSLILEEGLGMKELERILSSIQQAASEADVIVVTGDTKVVEKGKGDRIFINTSGIGELHPAADIGLSRIEEGDKILVSGPIGSHGMAIMSKREGLSFETDIASDTRSLNKPVNLLLDRIGKSLHFMRDPTRGGLATVMAEIASQSGQGLQLEENALPVLPQVEAACEMLGIDPLYVANEGIFSLIVEAGKAEEALALLKQEGRMDRACIIGEVVAGHPGKAILQSRIGGRRVLNLLPGEQLPRIC